MGSSPILATKVGCYLLQFLGKEDIPMGDMSLEKKAKVMKLQNRISLLESRGEYNRKLVNSLKRELRNLTK